MKLRLRLGLLALGAIALAWLVAAPEGQAAPGERQYEVTIRNLTSSQPLSPPIFVTHSKKVDVFQVGQAASEGIRQIAENGDNAPLAATLGGLSGVSEVKASGTPVHRIGGPGSNSMTVTIGARGDDNRLSLATMLICTNDGFTGVDSVKLPGGFTPVMYHANAYDAGTEANDQLYTHIVDPCGAIGPVPVAPDGMNLRTATSGVIAMHPGIVASGDLTAAHAWSNPVLEVTIRRMK